VEPEPAASHEVHEAAQNVEPETVASHHVTEPEIAEPEPVVPHTPAAPVAESQHAEPAVSTEETQENEAVNEFPQDAVSALGAIDMPLPPRIADPIPPLAPLSTQPVASPESTAAQAVPFDEPSAPFAAEAITGGMTGPGAIAGLGAPRFGSLSLDFDLHLPPDSAEPLPVFTPDQLARIARNKLELAHEYIALGDLAGARALINEVIESHDDATRTDAQALLSTLAPLS
jgi:FimV-like protein